MIHVKKEGKLMLIFFTLKEYWPMGKLKSLPGTEAHPTHSIGLRDRYGTTQTRRKSLPKTPISYSKGL